ncbi:DUF599 domain-containing protein [Pinisolibacter sp.]|uniref:DUF599 domain-containing protein n=1 Tax=Pinisolibacter sp. TaxID=2172024 RepID=UPI002FDEA868
MPFEPTLAMAIDLAALLVTLTALVGYHVFLGFKVRHNKNFTFQATMTKSRAAWVRAVMAEGKDVLAVQTLRNSTMAATFMASTAVLLIIGVLTLSAQGERLEASWHVLNPMGPSGAVLWTVKTLILLVDLFAAFLSFTMAIRQFHHVGYMINVPLSGKYGRIPLDTVVAQLERSGRFYWFGMRTYFLLVPLVLWLFGPYMMLAATAVLIAVLYRLDHMPLDEERVMEATEKGVAPRFEVAAE